MRTTPFVILGLSLVASALVFGGYFYRARAGTSTIKVVGAATKRYDSDVVKWRITVGRNVGLGDTRTGYTDTRRDFETLMAQLRAAGIKDQDITVQPINRSSTFDNQGQVTGQSFTQSVYVISTDLPVVEKLALNPDTLFSRGVALQNSNLEYYFSKLPDIKKELLAEATKDAKNRAEEIARNSGARIGRVASARTGIFQLTEPYSTEVSDYGIYNTATRQKDVTVTVTCEFSIR